MAMNPDFTKLNLEDHPSCDYDTWKKGLEETTGKSYNDLYDTTLERIPVGPLYTKDIQRMQSSGFHERYSSLPQGTVLHHVCIPPVDCPPVRRLLHCRRIQCLL